MILTAINTLKNVIAITCCCLFPLLLSAQDSSRKIPVEYFNKVSSQSAQLANKLEKKSAKALQQLQRQEAKIRQKLFKIDSAAATSIFSQADDQYKQLQEKMKASSGLTQYIPHLDSVTTSLNFLEQNPQHLSQVSSVKEKLKEAINKTTLLKDQLQKAVDIKNFLQERKQFLKEQLSKFGFAKQLKKINKQAYYYAAQIKAYKEVANDPKKIEKKALEILGKTKLFKDFIKKNSMLALLFRLPDDDASPGASLAGLQTRVQVNNIIQQQVSAGGPNAQQQFQQNIQAAQSQLNELKNKVMNTGSSDIEMPDFKPNNQKAKSFVQRLEYGANIQSQKATYFFPTTSDIGLSVGYKLNDKSVIGIGASYKIGLGRGWNNIAITHQGIGLRTYADVKLKGSLWISGGYEQNYKTAFNDFDVLRKRSGWQQSGLVGLSKVISFLSPKGGVGGGLFKKTKMMLLWDFLSYGQIPQTQTILFRIEYKF